MTRTKAVIAATVTALALLTGCSDNPGDKAEVTSADGKGVPSDSIRVVKVNVNARTVTCVVFSDTAGYAGMGGISCDWTRSAS